MYLRGIAPEMKNGLFSMLSELPFDHVITMHVDAMDQAEAVQEIEKKLAYMHKEEYDAIAKARERNMPASIAVSYDLKSKMHHTEQMMDDITTKNQKIFKVCILIHTYGDSNAQLDERVRRICSTVQQQTCRFDSILYEQRNAMNSMLPLGKKWLGLERTLETVSTAIYVPFTTQELFQPGGLYEGINARSKNLILCNRKLLPAPAGMVLGMTGYGKSFSVMQMVTNIMLRWPDDDIVLIDPEQEYTHLVTAMGGVVIDISASSPSHINPMDITEDYGDDEDPIRLKSQFLQNFCQLILHSSELSPQERTFIDVAAGLTYQRYMANPKREEMPTLHDFYRNLALQGEEVKPLLTALKLYVSGSMDLFAHQTNVNVQNHCICFNTVKLGKSMQSIGMLTVLDQVWNRITRNRVLGRRTWVFTDEFQQLLGNKDCTDFYFQLSSRARKWGAILTSITQHVRSVLDNEDARRMLSDCGYIKLLNQSPDDANDLARLLHISNEEKRYIENAEVGSGLLIVSKTVVPFNNDFPKDTELFNGNPYGYDTLTGQRSNNMQHGVTWSYANGIYNDTAEIISMAAVYYQQDWPSSQELASFTDDVPFTQYCRALTAYGMEITARESAPYSCISYGGCVNGYRSEGETVTITEYRCETHTCAQGNEECGHYRNGIWEWSGDHEEGSSRPEWIEDGTHDVTVFFPVIFPDGATQSELCILPDDYTQVVDGKITAENCTGSIVLDESANLYKGELNDWFYAPNERTATITVETTDGDEVMTKDYTVTFANATAIPWCPGELHNGQYGHYDLNCTIYLTGYDRYADPETEAPNGADGGTGTLEALAASSNDGTLTRTVIKQDQYGNAYAGNAVTARFTKTVTLPPGAAGFKGWYENGTDTYGNVEWASLLYRMDWEALYGVADGIKCRSVGSALTAEELQTLLAGLNIDPDTARGQVVAFAISCQGHFVYGQPSSLRGGPGNASVGMNLDCSSFVQYCYWAQGLPFSAGNTAAYGRTGDLRAISSTEVQPGDLRVVYAAGGEQGHVQMALGGGAWIECCYGYGVCVNMSNAWMESRGCHYFTYVGF